MQDVGTEKIHTSGVRKEYEYDRRPNQMLEHRLSFDQVSLATVRVLVDPGMIGHRSMVYLSF